MALSPSPPPPATAAAAPDTQQPPPPQLPHSPPDTSSTPASTSLGGDALPLPADAQRWSIDDVHRWAQSQALLAPVASVLRQHAVDGHVLLNYVTNTILGEELGIAAFGTRVHILEAIEMLRWSLGQGKPSPQAKACNRDRSLSPASSAHSDSHSRSHSRSPSPGSEQAASSTSPGPGHGGKRSASRIADAEKKRLKRAEMKKNPALYAEYLQKERERNARRRERLRAERGRSNSGGTAADLGSLRPDYAKPYYTGIR
ncbi:hypothetical protein H4S07_005318 [Coemansia furcata]|uniref:Uncharacterized protein n=1 Tax=Coemansia furcata TaxID=417177 RepID=A0ACC1L2W6_9FUNG|nr:hypothetical protein H4S07_005318 [Coemansia furcata]